MFYDIYLDEMLYLFETKTILSEQNNIFAGLDRYSKNEINNFRNGKIIVLRKENDIDNFICTSRNVLSNNEKLYYGKINDQTANKILTKIPYNLKGFNLSLQRHNYKHIEKKHGSPIKEISKGQINITNYDFYLIPTIIENFDNLKITHKNEYNNKSMILTKEINNIIYHLIVYLSFKNHNIEIKTFYKTKKRTLATMSQCIKP